MAAERYLSRRIPDLRVGNNIDEIDKKLIPASIHPCCNATFKWTANNTKFGFNEEMYIGLTNLYQLKDPFLNCVCTFVEITGKLTFRNSRAVIG